MRRSSTSSSDAKAGRRRPWGVFALLVLALLTAVELSLRSAAVRTLLPPRTHYYHPVIAQRLDALERLASVHKRVDILFIGSSIVLTNVHPLLFDSIVGGRPGRVVSFNAGLPGVWPTSVHLYLEHVWLSAVRPRIVVQGVRFAELAATTHAKHETQVWTGRVEPAWRESGWMTRVYAGLVERFHLLQYRGAATRALEQYRNGWIGNRDDNNSYRFYGYVPRHVVEKDSSKWIEDLPNEGTCDGHRCQVGFAALRRSIAAARAIGASYVLVNVPEHPLRWRGPDAAARYVTYIDRLRSFAQSEGVAFIDPTDGDPAQFGHVPYQDFSHMAVGGSHHFTRVLAERMNRLVLASRM